MTGLKWVFKLKPRCVNHNIPKWNQASTKKLPYRNQAELRADIGEELRLLRSRLNLTQRQLAEALGVSQSQIPKWETGTLTPPTAILAVIADIALGDEKDWWRGLAGLREEKSSVEYASRSIPQLRDPAAAGTPRALDEGAVAQYLTLPTAWLPRGGTLYAITVKGTSMEPILCTGFVVIVDVERRKVESLVNCMVVARFDDGVTVKWLRKTQGAYMLVPENMNAENVPQVIHPGSDIHIVGCVVKWIGEPNSTKKRK